MRTDKLIDALRDVLRAESEMEEARERYTGFDWGYHGQHLVNAVTEARAEFSAALDAVILERINAVFAEAALNRPSNDNA